MVGNVAIGSEHPIRIQTMTTTDTKDVAGTVEQVLVTTLILLLQISQITSKKSIRAWFILRIRVIGTITSLDLFCMF